MPVAIVAKKPKRDFRFFERWCRQHGMRPIERITDVTVNGVSVGDILLADSEELILQSSYPPMAGQEHGMVAFFRTGFAIDRPGDKTWLASFNDYPPDAFSDYEQSSRKGERLKEALEYAARAIQQTHDAGLYRGNDRQIIH